VECDGLDKREAVLHFDLGLALFAAEKLRLFTLTVKASLVAYALCFLVLKKVVQNQSPNSLGLSPCAPVKDGTICTAVTLDDTTAARHRTAQLIATSLCSPFTCHLPLRSVTCFYIHMGPMCPIS
jgi:hypothetical protein